MARITGDLFDVTEFSHHCPEEFFIAGLKIVVSFVILCTVNVPLTIIIFAIVPVMAIIAGKFNMAMRRTFAKNRRQVGEVNAQVEDSLRARSRNSSRATATGWRSKRRITAGWARSPQPPARLTD